MSVYLLSYRAFSSVTSRLAGKTRLGLSSAQRTCCQFHTSRTHRAVRPFLLADVGEGITECQIIQWFVQPGARVEEFDKICEVQSDKASVEITSPFAGVIKELHYKADDMAVTGRPLLDIDAEEDEETSNSTQTIDPGKAEQKDELLAEGGNAASSLDIPNSPESTSTESRFAGIKSLATPAVRHLTRKLNVSIEEVNGTGKDGRVLREDVLNHTQQRDSGQQTDGERSTKHERVPLTPVQNQMFKTMSKSLSIPHFLYTCSTDMSKITDLRRKLSEDGSMKVTAFAFIMKAVSIAFRQHRLLNASLDLTESKPALIHKQSHDFGIAIDTPSGLVVPVVRGVQDLSIEEIANTISDISARARDNKLSPTDYSGASFTLSNIGAIGGGVVSPVISEPQVAIVGIGRSRVVPAFDIDGNLYKREELVLSWSADHRVVDGAECARCAESVRSLLESPASMMLAMR